MQKGYVVLETTVLLLIGVAGAGKSSFCRLLFNEPPPKVRSSTPIAQSSIRAMSLTKACVQIELEETIWEKVTAKKLNYLIADGIKSVHTHVAHQTLISHAHSEDEVHRTLVQPIEDIQNINLNISKVSSNATSTHKQSDSVIKPKQGANVDTANTEVAGNSEPIKSDVAQLFEMEHVKELLKTVASVEGSGEIFKRKWLYIIDTGGQPQFHELLPTFVHHVSAAVLFVKLNELLKANPIIEYYKDDILCGKPYKSSYNHLQILQNCLQAMQSRNQMNSSSQCPKFLFVGTHRDKQSWFTSEGLKSKNAQLLEMLLQHDTFRDNLIYYSMGESDQLLYPVNAKNPNSRDKQVAANFRQKVMSQCQTQEYKIPIRWFTLEQLLQDLSKDGVISFDKCVEVASHLGMDKEQLLAALEHLVKLNIFEYHSKVSPKVVFTTSQVLLDKITELIEYSHLLRGASFHNVGLSDPKFREYGMINADMLKRERFSSHFIRGLFEVKDLLNIWVELLVVAEGKDGNFIVPAVLPDISLEKISEYRLSIHSSEVIPIAIHYPGSFFPSGIFSSLVSYLQNKSGDWAISIKGGKPACLYKNCVNFSVSGNVTANVILIYSHEWIELRAMALGQSKKKVCLLLNHIFKGIRLAQEIQKYDDFAAELAFFCLCNESNPHLASPIAPDDDVMQCRRDQTKYSDLNEKHKLWLERTQSDGKFSLFCCNRSSKSRLVVYLCSS
jgi:GTPase SAR1 family protein